MEQEIKLTKEQLTKLIKWMESEDYLDFADNFTTLKRRTDYIYNRHLPQ